MKLDSDTAISQVGFCVSTYVHVCMWVNKKKTQLLTSSVHLI